MSPCHRGPRFGPATAVLLGGVLLLAGCVSSKYEAASALGAQPRWINANLGIVPLKTRLDTVIIYQGPGSWKKSAYWDEILLTFTNESDAPITLTSAGLIDYFGTIMPAGSDPWSLEKASQFHRDRYLQAGVNFALHTIGYAALTYGALGAGAVIGGVLTNSWAGLTAGATVGVAAVPVTAIVIYVNNQKHRRLIEAEFQRRRLTLPLTLAPGEARSGSLFFPMTVSPQSLRLEWLRDDQADSSLLPVPMLAGLHRKVSAVLSPPAPVVTPLP